MALGSSNLFVSKEDFLSRIDELESKMQALYDVVQRYENAKKNLDQFIVDGDTNYNNMIENINEHINAAKKSYSALNEMKENLKKTVDQMDSMSGKVAETITSATEAAKSTIEAAFKVNSIL